MGPTKVHVSVHLATKHLEAGLPWPLRLVHEPHTALTQGPGPKLSFRWPPWRLMRSTLICTCSPGKGLLRSGNAPVWGEKRECRR